VKKLISLLLLSILLTLVAISCGPDAPPTPKETELLQEGNELPRNQLQPLESGELEDNRIGIMFCDLWHPQWEAFPDGVLDASHILSEGVKRARFAINHLDYQSVQWGPFESSIDPSHDEFITSLADNGITLTFVLTFWDMEYHTAGIDTVTIPRFKTEDEIQRYLDYVRFIVRHFKDRVEYYEIWNEPNNEGMPQSIEVEDYINLVKRTVPVIREEYPEAKIVVGGVAYLRQQDAYNYLLAIISSDEIMPLVDVISWHAMYGTSPEHEFHRDYYYEYPSIVQEIKDVASTHGFNGEYVADELSWMTLKCPVTNPLQVTYSETKSAKYYARGILMNLGMDVAVSQFYHVPGEHPLQIVQTIRNLCTVMAGAEPASLPVEIESAADNIESYAFSLPNGDKLLALWVDGTATDGNPSIEATLTLPDFSAQKVVAIDVLNSFEQEMVTEVDDGDLVISNLLVKDYPIILRFTP
jgi:hypothetical protein